VFTLVTDLKIKLTRIRQYDKARDASRLGEAIDIAAAAVAQRFEQEAVDDEIQAHVVTLEK
jgi:hypothetical protein